MGSVMKCTPFEELGSNYARLRRLPVDVKGELGLIGALAGVEDGGKGECVGAHASGCQVLHEGDHIAQAAGAAVCVDQVV